VNDLVTWKVRPSDNVSTTINPPTDLIDTPEGQPFYGGIRLSLTTSGDVTAASGLAVDRFPTADADGSYVYERTFELPAGTVPTDLLDGVVVVHGISELFGDDAAYDGEPRSSINSDLPLEATIPALYGDWSRERSATPVRHGTSPMPAFPPISQQPASPTSTRTTSTPSPPRRSPWARATAASLPVTRSGVTRWRRSSPASSTTWSSRTTSRFPTP
jgi:hypothetical protein